MPSLQHRSHSVRRTRDRNVRRQGARRRKQRKWPRPAYRRRDRTASRVPASGRSFGTSPPDVRPHVEALTLWRRFSEATLDDLQARSSMYIAASRRRSVIRIEAAPARRSLPPADELDFEPWPMGRLVFLRRTTDAGRATVLGHSLPVDRHWLHRLIRAEVDLDDGRIRFYALRRREPDAQPLIGRTAVRATGPLASVTRRWWHMSSNHRPTDPDVMALAGLDATLRCAPPAHDADPSCGRAPGRGPYQRHALPVGFVRYRLADRHPAELWTDLRGGRPAGSAPR
jgi:hypothetical protein